MIRWREKKHIFELIEIHKACRYNRQIFGIAHTTNDNSIQHWWAYDTIGMKKCANFALISVM